MKNKKIFRRAVALVCALMALVVGMAIPSAADYPIIGDYDTQQIAAVEQYMGGFGINDYTLEVYKRYVNGALRGIKSAYSYTFREGIPEDDNIGTTFYVANGAWSSNYYMGLNATNDPPVTFIQHALTCLSIYKRYSSGAVTLEKTVHFRGKVTGYFTEDRNFYIICWYRDDEPTSWTEYSDIGSMRVVFPVASATDEGYFFNAPSWDLYRWDGEQYSYQVGPSGQYTFDLTIVEREYESWYNIWNSYDITQFFTMGLLHAYMGSNRQEELKDHSRWYYPMAYTTGHYRGDESGYENGYVEGLNEGHADGYQDGLSTAEKGNIGSLFSGIFEGIYGLFANILDFNIPIGNSTLNFASIAGMIIALLIIVGVVRFLM